MSGESFANGLDTGIRQYASSLRTNAWAWILGTRLCCPLSRLYNAKRYEAMRVCGCGLRVQSGYGFYLARPRVTVGGFRSNQGLEIRRRKWRSRQPISSCNFWRMLEFFARSFLSKCFGGPFRRNMTMAELCRLFMLSSISSNPATTLSSNVLLNLKVWCYRFRASPSAA